MDTNTELYHDVPCSSIAVESIISVGTGGLIWGLCSGSYDAKQKGLTGVSRASFLAKTVGKYGFQCGNLHSCRFILFFKVNIFFNMPVSFLRETCCICIFIIKTVLKFISN
ncbi:putative mitochondrial import inner membrane translocase subunit TIM22 [Helianthus annuus]|nr:putative mitochondrial import inner membrane translocase subunit TIM22 [Helianthus annuus]